jgi:glycosyltransferase involved in cell wall biosynthesis
MAHLAEARSTLPEPTDSLEPTKPEPGTAAPVSVILPAYNEAQAMHGQLAAIHDALGRHGIPYEIVVVDDGSRDGTAEAALRCGARVVQQVENHGYGAALKIGISAAKHDCIVIMDADGTYPADQIPKLLELMTDADMVVGARIGAVVHVPLLRRPARWILTRVAERVAGRSIPDLNSGLRAFRRSCVQQYFPLLSNQFSFTSTLTLAYLADGYRVLYHPINYYPRIGQSKIVPRHFFDFMVLLMRTAILFEPMKIFLPLALFFGLLGGLKVVFDVLSFGPRTGSFNLSILFQPVLSTSAILLLLAGLQLLLFGMVADGLFKHVATHETPLVRSHAVRFYEAPGTAEAPRDEAEAPQRTSPGSR